MRVQVIKSKKTRKSRIRVAAYCRVSTETEIQEGSIENQIEHYEELIKSNPDYKFVNVYYDFGISGYKEQRPGFQDMMKDARSGKIDLIITKSITRFARNTNTLLKATRELKSLGVAVSLHTEVRELLCEQDKVCGVLLTNGKKMKADAVIVATGGISYPSTGSTGDGYRFAKETGHRVTELLPSLVPMEVRQWYAKELQGLSLRNIEICITDGKKKLYEEFGEMLFTHYGVTGPVILSASSVVGKTLRKKELTLHIDLKPALSEEQLDKRILREFDANHNKQYKNSIDSLFPAKLKPVMIELSEIEPEKKVNEITKEERQRLVHLIKDFTMTLTGLRSYNEAIITKGGVSVKEIDPGTMESKKMKGLYFAGEVLDLDAVTGGYNLQIAWSTGYLAGMNAGCD